MEPQERYKIVFDKFIFPKFKEEDPDLVALKKEMNIRHIGVDFSHAFDECSTITSFPKL